MGLHPLDSNILGNHIAGSAGQWGMQSELKGELLFCPFFPFAQYFHSSTDSGWNTWESNQDRQKISLFRLYFVLLLQTYVLEQGIDQNSVIFKNLTK